MAVVKDFMLGQARIIICDDACVSKSEAQEILKNMAKRIQPHMCYVERKKAEQGLNQNMEEKVNGAMA